MIEHVSQDPVFMRAAPKPLDGRKARRKHFTVVELPARVAKGKFPKGKGFRKGAHADGQVVMGDRVFRTGHALGIKDAREDPYLRR